jgi:bile acid:Na+ symporter, BASS family
MRFGCPRSVLFRTLLLVVLLGFAGEAGAAATELSGEDMYRHLVEAAKDNNGELFQRLGAVDLSGTAPQSESFTFDGYLRNLDVPTGKAGDSRDFYFVRSVTGEIYVLDLPQDASALEPGGDSPYSGIAGMVGKKNRFTATKHVWVDGQTAGGAVYHLIVLEAKPERLLVDRLFFVAIVLLLFLTMVGMGLTLTPKDFALVFKKPQGMLVGPLCQFGLLPLLAMGVGRLFGFYETYPFIFLGLILIASSPGGVTSNLMTYFGKGDVALSVSLTAVCTVLALFFTPLLLQAYGSNIPDFSIPVMEVFKTMLVLVVVPLFVGMLVRWKAESFARKAEKTFALIGIFALLFLIVVGIWTNLDKFADTARYGVSFYAVIFLLTFAGMVAAALVAKLLRVKNYQVRAISLECGLRNASLAMTIALLLQDQMGDFYSSMFFTSGIFGLWMYVAGVLTIYLFPKVLPLSKEELASHQKARSAS